MPQDTHRGVSADRPRATGVMLRDRGGRELDTAPLQSVLDRIVATWRPAQIWLFGSRARGDADATSDWDLLAVVPDDLDESQFDPRVGWAFRKSTGVRAHVIPCHVGEFDEDRSIPNTIAYEAATNGVLVYER